MKVLVVGNPAIRPISYVAGLRELGYVVDAENDSAEAIARAAGRDYDLVILDLASPRESSLLALHEIRERNANVEILLLSEQEQIHDRVTALIQGADDYLLKPFSVNDLHARIRELVRRKIERIQANANEYSPPQGGDHTDRLIANLLDNCNCERGPIELVISEVKLAPLLSRVAAELRKKLPGSGDYIRYPQGRLPTLLVDAGLMQSLLVMLITAAAARRAAATDIEVEFGTRQEYCTVTIGSRLRRPMTATGLEEIFRDPVRRGPVSGANHAAAGLSLARNFAERMNLELRPLVDERDRLRIRLSNIRIV